MKTKPIDADVWLIYKCCVCGTTHEVRRGETQFPGGVLCSCGEKIEFEPISKVTLHFTYEQPVTDAQAKAVHFLVMEQGYEQDEAKHLVLEASKRCNSNKVAEIVKAAVQLSCNGMVGH